MNTIYSIIAVIVAIAIIALIVLGGGTPVVQPPVEPQATTTDLFIFRVGENRTVFWNKTALNNDTVQVNIIKRVTESPMSYDLVDKLGISPNNGQFTWVASSTQVGDNLYLEVGCPSGIDHECHAIPPMGPFTVLTGK